MAAARYAVFVDAGYLYGASAHLLTGHPGRVGIDVDAEMVAAQLCNIVAALHPGAGEHLRTYWYDGAPNYDPTAEQQAIASLDGVKLRLGNLRGEDQKGVDSRIVRDLIVLSADRSISHAILVSGDEDLVEGVVESQERGVKVTVVGIEAPPGLRNMSKELARAADRVTTLGRAIIEQWVTVRAPAQERVQVGAGDDGIIAIGRKHADSVVNRFGFAVVHAGITEGSEAMVPRAYDGPLLDEVRFYINNRYLSDETREIVRNAFLARVAQLGDADAQPQAQINEQMMNELPIAET